MKRQSYLLMAECQTPLSWHWSLYRDSTWECQKMQFHVSTYLRQLTIYHIIMLFVLKFYHFPRKSMFFG